MRIKSIKFQYLIVLSANICVLILGFVISIVTTHIMDTAEYGYYKAFINSLMMLTSLSNFGFHMTYAREFANSSSQEYEKKLVGSSILINLGIAIIVFTGTVVVCLIGKISGWYQLDSYILLASVFVFLLLLQYLCLQRMQGQNRMLEYALITLIPQIVLTGFYLVEYLKKHEINAKSSITVYVAANAVVLMWLMFERGVNFRCDNELCHVFKVNKGYGFNIYIGALASVTSAQILSLLIATIAGLEEYALFSLGLSIASPMMYIPVTMGTVQFKKNIQLY
jgi:O-antigen/teichoic acid export membrane protein